MYWHFDEIWIPTVSIYCKSLPIKSYKFPFWFCLCYSSHWWQCRDCDTKSPSKGVCRAVSPACQITIRSVLKLLLSIMTSRHITRSKDHWRWRDKLRKKSCITGFSVRKWAELVCLWCNGKNKLTALVSQRKL